MFILRKPVLFILLVTAFSPVHGKGVYQEPVDFINEVFNHNPPEPGTLWIRDTIRENIKEILGHDLDVLRLRYWLKDDRSAWILEEIGKERLITTGIVVNQDGIELVRVLVFREIRGWEIRYPFFTDQFKGVRLNSNTELDKHIDGISGATLSVNAVTRLTRLALTLHEHVTGSKPE